MAISTTFPDVVPPTGETRRAATAPSPAARPGLFARCGGWLRRRDDARPPARDGAAPGARHRRRPGLRPCPEGFAVDPRPLWGIGLTPQPMASSLRAERRKG